AAMQLAVQIAQAVVHGQAEYCLAVFSLVNLQAQQAAKGAGIAHRLDLNAHALLPQALGVGKQRRHGIVRWCGLVLGRVALTARRVAARLAAPWARSEERRV